MPGILLAIGWFTLLLFGMRRMRFFREAPGLPMRAIAALFGIKVLAGTALWAVYTYVYTDRATADIYKYFDDSLVMHEALWHRPGDYLRMLLGVGNDSAWFTEQYYSRMNHWVRRWDPGLHNDAHTMIRLNALLRLLSFGHYHVHTVFAALVSTAGSVALYRALQPWAQGLRRGLAATIFLWPSVLFWSSGVLKECLLMAGLGFAIWGVLGDGGLRTRWRWPLLLAAVSVMLLVKVYVLVCLLPPLVAFAWCRARPGRVLARYLAVHAAVAVAVLLIGARWPAYDPLYLLAMKQHDFIGLVREVPTGSYVVMEPLLPTVGSFLRQLPHALWMAFGSPFAVLDTGPLAWLGAVESAVLVLLPLLALARRRAWPDVPWAALLFALGFVLLLALVIGWTVPVVGALLRYRVPMLPFAGLVALLLVDPARLPSRLRNLLTG